MSCFTAYQPRFPLELLISNPVTEHLAESKEERISTWVGRDTHTNFMALPKPQGLMVFVTHEVIYFYKAGKLLFRLTDVRMMAIDYPSHGVRWGV